MSFEVFMQVRCLQKSKWRWNRGNKGAKMHKQSSQWNFAPWTHSVRIFRTVTVHGAKRSILDDSHDSHFWSTSRSPFRAYHMSFQSLGSQESIASNGAQFGFETKKLWPFEKNPISHLHEWIVPCAKFAHPLVVCENFAHHLPCANLLLHHFSKIACSLSWRITGMRKFRTPFSPVRKFRTPPWGVRNSHTTPPLCEIFAPLFPCANFWASSSLPSPIPSLWALSSTAQSGAHSSFL